MRRFTFTDDNNNAIVANLYRDDSMSIVAIDSTGRQFTLVYPEGDILSTFSFKGENGETLTFGPGELNEIWTRAGAFFGFDI